MAAFLLDTNHASAVVTLEHPLYDQVIQSLEAGDIFAVCTPIVIELLFGIGMLPRSILTMQEWRRLRPLIE